MRFKIGFLVFSAVLSIVMYYLAYPANYEPLRTITNIMIVILALINIMANVLQISDYIEDHFPKPIKDLNLDLAVSLMDLYLLPESKIEEVVYGYSVDENDMVLCSLPFKIRNNGELTAKNLIFRIVFPLVLRDGGFQNKVRMDSKLGDASDVKRKSSILKGNEYVDYTIPLLNPKYEYLIEEFINIIYASGRKVDVNTITKDGVPIKLTTQIDWSAEIHIKLGAMDFLPIESDFEIKSYQTNDREELLQKIIEVDTQELRDQLLEIGIPKKFVSYAYAPIRKKTLIIFPSLKKIPKPKGYPIKKGYVYQEEPEKSERWLLLPKSIKDKY